MRCGQRAMVLIWQPFGRFVSEVASIQAADRLLQGPVAKDWVTNGRNLANQRKSMRRIWSSSKKRGGLASNTRVWSEVFGRGDSTRQGRDHVHGYKQRRCLCPECQAGEILCKRWSWIDQKTSVVFCGWVNCGLAA